MKQRIKHFSKSTMSVILAVCMLVSCLTVGWIATDAAQVAEDESVGDSKVSFAYAYFAVPDSWTMTGKNVYLAYTKTDGPNYTRFLQMTRLGETNLYAFDGSTYTDNKDHYSLGFVASASTPSGSNLDDLSSFTSLNHAQSLYAAPIAQPIKRTDQLSSVPFIPEYDHPLK